MSYETGSFINYDKTVPGVYSKITDNNNTRYSAPFGGVTIPVTVISHAPDAEWPVDYIEVNRSNKLLVMEQYTIERRQNIEQMVDEALRNADRVFLIPFDGVTKVPDEIKGVRTFGKGKHASVEAWFGDDPTKNENFEILSGIRVHLEYSASDDKVTFQFYAPDGQTCYGTENIPKISNEVKASGEQINVNPDNLLTATEQATSAYKTNPQGTYTKLHFIVYLHEKFVAGYADDFVLFGGSGEYENLVTIINGHANTKGTGVYVACNMTTTGGELSRQVGSGEGAYFYIVSSTGYAGTHSGYYLDIQRTSDGGTTEAKLMYIDASANVYPPYTKEIEVIKLKNTDRIDRIGQKFGSIQMLYDGKEMTAPAFAEMIPPSGRVIIGFSPIFDRIDEKTRFTNFMHGSGRTNADVLYYPNWSDELTDADDFGKCLIKYQEIQNWYLSKRQDECNLTQLLMDESLKKEGRKWVTGKPMTLNDPFLVSLKSGKGNKSASQRIGAFTAGLLTACGAYRSANAMRYDGGARLEVYRQEEIVDMFKNRVMTYHEHFNQMVLYADRSAYDKTTAGDQRYPKAFERNKSVRACNLLTFLINRMFFFNYMNQSQKLINPTAQMIEHDIYCLIESMSKQGAFVQPDANDVTVTQHTPESYIADVRLRMVEPPEILYVTIGL